MRLDPVHVSHAQVAVRNRNLPHDPRPNHRFLRPGLATWLCVGDVTVVVLDLTPSMALEAFWELGSSVGKVGSVYICADDAPANQREGGLQSISRDSLRCKRQHEVPSIYERPCRGYSCST